MPDYNCTAYDCAQPATDTAILTRTFVTTDDVDPGEGNFTFANDGAVEFAISHIDANKGDDINSMPGLASSTWVAARPQPGQTPQQPCIMIFNQDISTLSHDNGRCNTDGNNFHNDCVWFGESPIIIKGGNGINNPQEYFAVSHVYQFRMCNNQIDAEAIYNFFSQSYTPPPTTGPPPSPDAGPEIAKTAENIFLIVGVLIFILVLIVVIGVVAYFATGSYKSKPKPKPPAPNPYPQERDSPLLILSNPNIPPMARSIQTGFPYSSPVTTIPKTRFATPPRSTLNGSRTASRIQPKSAPLVARHKPPHPASKR